MVEFVRNPAVTRIGPEYNTFLYATIGADPSGSELSVLSAMARLNLDPWQEAAKLAELSAMSAARKLTSLIAALPGAPADEPALIAARLIKLLPQQSRLSLAPPQQNRLQLPPQLLTAVRELSSIRVICVVLVLIVLTLGAKWFLASKSPVANGHPVASEPAAPPNVPRSH